MMESASATFFFVVVSDVANPSLSGSWKRCVDGGVDGGSGEVLLVLPLLCIVSEESSLR